MAYECAGSLRDACDRMVQAVLGYVAPADKPHLARAGETDSLVQDESNFHQSPNQEPEMDRAMAEEIIDLALKPSAVEATSSRAGGGQWKPEPKPSTSQTLTSEGLQQI